MTELNKYLDWIITVVAVIGAAVLGYLMLKASMAVPDFCGCAL
jgi:hypothetical protein